MFPSVYTKADAIQHPDDPECCFHPVLVLLYFFFHALCAKVYLSPRLCCPKSKSGPPQTAHSEAAQDARSLLLLIFLFPNLGHKYNFQVARVRFPLHIHIMLPFPPQVAISLPSFYLGYCEMPILLLGKTSNLNVGSADADCGHCQLQVE